MYFKKWQWVLSTDEKIKKKIYISIMRKSKNVSCTCNLNLAVCLKPSCSTHKLTKLLLVVCCFYFVFSCHSTLLRLYISSFVHRNSVLKKSNKMQQHEDIYLLLNYSTCFGRPSLPLSGVHKTAFTAYGTDHTVKYKSWTRSVILTYRL